jgi:hypothetical protein
VPEDPCAAEAGGRDSADASGRASAGRWSALDFSADEASEPECGHGTGAAAADDASADDALPSPERGAPGGTDPEDVAPWAGDSPGAGPVAAAERSGLAEGGPAASVEPVRGAGEAPSPGRAERGGAGSDGAPVGCGPDGPAPDEGEGASEGVEPGDAPAPESAGSEVCARSPSAAEAGRGLGGCSGPLALDALSADVGSAGRDDDGGGRSIEAVRRSDRTTNGRGYADPADSPRSGRAPAAA